MLTVNDGYTQQEGGVTIMVMVVLQAGMEAPHFELPDADMETFSLGAQRGKKNVVLYLPQKRHTGLHLGGKRIQRSG